jgi:hypothetical protein
VVDDGIDVLDVLVVPWPLLTTAGGLAEGPPEPHAANKTPARSTPTRRVAPLTVGFE